MFKNPAGQRKAIHLGRVPDRDADKIKEHVEQIVTAMQNNVAPHHKTMDWLAKIGEDLYDKLAAVGLVMPRVAEPATACCST